MLKVTIFTDGGSRGNPGPAATGVVIKDQTKKNLLEYGEYLGEQTNNYAEYAALISGLQKAKELGADEVECMMDSELVVKQMNRQYKVREPGLQKLFIKAYNEAGKFTKVSFKHIFREANKEADKMVNTTLDKQR